MRQHQKLEHMLPAVAIILSLLSVGCGWFCSEEKESVNGVDKDGKKIYITKPSSIAKTRSFRQFMLSPQTESEKLQYLISRLGDLTEYRFRYLGSYFEAADTKFGFNWLMTHRYKNDQNAHEFVKEQVGLLESMGNQLAIKFPDGSVHLALPIVLNELDLLERAMQKEEHFPLPDYDRQKAAAFESSTITENAYTASKVA